jgi:hypothetical protein
MDWLLIITYTKYSHLSICLTCLAAHLGWGWGTVHKPSKAGATYRHIRTQPFG